MLASINLPLILAAGVISTASPGPAILAISGASLRQGRAYGLALAAGVSCGSWVWSSMAALGLGVVMLANAWALETVRIVGGLYLAWLALKAARARCPRARRRRRGRAPHRPSQLTGRASPSI